MDQALTGCAPDRPRVVLAHNPRTVEHLAGRRCDLMLSGHTHGGQLRLPGYGALVTNCGIPRSMASGLHRYTERDEGAACWLNVSAGLGTAPTAPVRFSCRPEATLLTLVSGIS